MLLCSRTFSGAAKWTRHQIPEDSLVVFERISRLYGEGLVTSEIDERLHSEFSRTIEIDHRSNSPAPQADGYAELASTFNDVLARVTACMEVMSNQKNIIDNQQEDIRKLKTAFVLLARSQKRMKQLPDVSMALPDDFLTQAKALEEKDAEIEEMALKLTFDTSDIKAKLQILESELVRLRKDRRDMEKYLQEKIDRLKVSAE